jgi:hypothetical protein
MTSSTTALTRTAAIEAEMVVSGDGRISECNLPIDLCRPDWRPLIAEVLSQ